MALRSQREKSTEELFHEKLGPKDPVTGCIEWIGSRDKGNYGHGRLRLKNGGKMYQAHRLAWELKHGPIPDGLCVLHRCDNPPCCNTDHLFLGTKADNNADRDAKGRCAKGERSGNSKLTTSDVIAIRRRVAAGERQKDLAKEFSVPTSAICNICNRKRWAHVP